MMHSASFANIFIQAQGCKHWTFVSPRYSVFLNPLLLSLATAAKVTSPAKGVPTWKLLLQQGAPICCYI